MFGSCRCYTRKATNWFFLAIFHHVGDTDRAIFSWYAWFSSLVSFLRSCIFRDTHAEQMMQQKGKPEAEQAQYRTKLESLSAQVLVLESAVNTGELQAQKRWGCGAQLWCNTALCSCRLNVPCTCALWRSRKYGTIAVVAACSKQEAEDHMTRTQSRAIANELL